MGRGDAERAGQRRLSGAGTRADGARSFSRPCRRTARSNFAEQLVDLDPLLFNGKVGSAFTRLSFTELANVSSGGGMVPTFIISEK